MNRIFVDMDGVIVDFEADMKRFGLTGDELKEKDNAYLEMEPIDGALEAVDELVELGFDVWIATKPPTGIAQAYADKVTWILHYLPGFEERIVITHDKGFLGDEGDFLLDDRPHRANCEKFKGTGLWFIEGYHWPEALAFLRTIKENQTCGN